MIGRYLIQAVAHWRLTAGDESEASDPKVLDRLVPSVTFFVKGGGHS